MAVGWLLGGWVNVDDGYGCTIMGFMLGTGVKGIRFEKDIPLSRWHKMDLRKAF
jgi:hypothetical protein